MAGALEVAKLVIASLLYQYWDTINKILRVYFVTACFILIVITSGGIYGYLSGAYEATATQSEFLDKQVQIVDSKRTRFEEQKSDLILEKESLVKSISDLRISLSNPTQVSWYDKEAEQVITTTSSRARKALQTELEIAISERDEMTIKIEAITDSIGNLDVVILDAQINNEAARELGPLKYMAELTGQPMAKIVNWFMLLIIFVFDPLAIAMVVAANMAFANIKGVARDPKDYEVYQQEEHTEDIIITPKKDKEILENLTYPEFVEKYYKKEKKEEIEEEIEKMDDPEFIKKYNKFISHLKNNGIEIPKKFQ
jgi:hypothetical protein